MKEPIVIRSDDPILNKLHFVPYRNMVQRQVRVFAPGEDEPQTMEVTTPWGAKLMVTSGDLLVNEIDKPNDVWPVAAQIFDETYLITSPGYCIKKAVTLLAPLVELTGGDEDQLVTVQSLEGDETVRAGDFYLAKGVKGEIWAYPKQKVTEMMRPVE